MSELFLGASGFASGNPASALIQLWNGSRYQHNHVQTALATTWAQLITIYDQFPSHRHSSIHPPQHQVATPRPLQPIRPSHPERTIRHQPIPDLEAARNRWHPCTALDHTLNFYRSSPLPDFHSSSSVWPCLAGNKAHRANTSGR